jgi:hypothetical protein
MGYTMVMWLGRSTIPATDPYAPLRRAAPRKPALPAKPAKPAEAAESSVV